MIKRPTCVEPELYTSQAQAPFDEARALLLARYTEKEVDPSLENRIREHLDRCACCTEWMREFKSTEPIAVASCPSSVDLDYFAFDRSKLTSAKEKKIEEHLADCPLCREEIQWLQKLEPAPGDRKGYVPPPTRRPLFQYLSLAAALFFMVLAASFYFDEKQTEHKLHALAEVKQPHEIDYASLVASSEPLPPELQQLYDQGVNALRGGRYEEAARHLHLVMNARSNHAGSVYLLGYAYYQLNEPQKAFDLCDRAEKIRPHSLERCLSLVHIALKTGHYGRAVREINGLYHEAPDHPQVRTLYHQISSITNGRILKL
jgi:tetratricopeptide (TPR) repeat protein